MNLDTTEMADRLYDAALSCWSDIQEHVGLLRGLAHDCGSVVEFGMRGGISTIAMLRSGARVTSYDVKDYPKVRQVIQAVWPTTFAFRQRSSTAGSIDECGMLFIDSLHEPEHLWKELTMHHGKVKHLIAMHDTHNSKFPLLHRTVVDFVHENDRRWKVFLDLRNSSGLTILCRK